MINKARQRGATVLEVLIATALLIAGIGIYVVHSRSDHEAEEEARSATHLQAFAGAADRYISANRTTLLAGPDGTVVTVPAAQLVSHIPGTVSVPGPLQHEYELRVRRTAGQLQGLLVSRTPGSADAARLARVSRLAGEAGGYVHPGPIAQSPAQGWRIQAHEWSAGGWGAAPPVGALAYALFYDDALRASLAGTALHRQRMDAAPHLNRMSTAIDMASNDLVGIGVYRSDRLEARQAVAHEGMRAFHVAVGAAPFGAVPYPYETIQVPDWSTLRLAVGDQELWQSWQGGTALNRNTAVTMSGTVAGALTAGGQAHSDTRLSSSGELHTGSWIRSWGDHGLYNETHGGGWHMTDANWVRSYNNRNVYTGGTVLSGAAVSNSRTVHGQATAHGSEYVGGQATVAGSSSEQGESWIGGRADIHDIQARRVVQCNAACSASETGLIATTGDGTPAACMAGRFECLGEGSGGGTPPPDVVPGCACAGHHFRNNRLIASADGKNYASQGACRGALNALGLFDSHYCEWEHRPGQVGECYSIIPRANAPVVASCPR